MSARDRSSVRVRFAWLLLAAAVFGVATAALYGPVWREDASALVPSRATSRALAPVLRDDHRFVVWAVARNARTLATEPWNLFDAEACFPDAESLALGEPVIAMGLYGAPIWLLGARDPLLLYNVVLVVMSLAAAFAMYALIVAWTGEPAAGIVAGLLYAFSRFAVLDPVHPYSSDTTPMVLCLLFAERLCAAGRWRDAFALAAAIALQLATSFYPLMASATLGAPFAVWLLVVHRRRLPWLPLGFVALAALGAAWVVLGPYLEMRTGGLLRRDVVQSFRGLSVYLPGGEAFFGWPGTILALAGIALPARHWQRSDAPDPRFILLGGALLLALLAAGPRGPVDLYHGLATVVPGLDTVRLPRKMMIGVPLVLSVLAGLGLCGVMHHAARWGGRARLGSAFAGVALALVAALGTSGHYRTLDVKPDPASVALYAELSGQGNAGPIYEAPIPRGPEKYGWSTTSRPLLLAYFHERRTSACYPSHPPPHRAELEAIEARLPSRDAVDDLARLGFTTIVVYDPPRTPRRLSARERFLAYSREPRSRLSELHRSDRLAAFEILAR